VEIPPTDREEMPLMNVLTEAIRVESPASVIDRAERAWDNAEAACAETAETSLLITLPPAPAAEGLMI